EEGEAGIHQELVRQSLISKGYLPPDAPAFTAGNPQWREAIGRFQADSGMVVNGVVDFSTYERALRDFVAVSADGHM
ncbi:peptidoglycan-binding protein, partial [Klebsiella pneumoniae]